MATIFTKIINKEIKADVVYEDDLAIAFRDIKPAAPVHVLIVPKKEIVSTSFAGEDDEKILGHLFVVARKVAEKEGIKEKGFRLIVNNGSDAGQEVQHLHIHLFGGMRMGWKPVG